LWHLEPNIGFLPIHRVPTISSSSVYLAWLFFTDERMNSPVDWYGEQQKDMTIEYVWILGGGFVVFMP
jgi:hypothetical protein